MHPTFRCAARSGAALVLALLAACGGGGGSGSAAPTADGSDQTPASPLPEVAFAAVSVSANATSLGWPRPSAAANYTIERRSAGGAWQLVDSVDARSAVYLDAGLAPDTDYQYRLVETGGAHRTLAERSVRTSNEQPVISASGDPVSAPSTESMNAAGGELKTPDGSIVVGVPAGAFTTPAQAQVQPVSNTAPEGRGPALRVRLDQTPAAPLTLTLRYDAGQDAEADGQRVALQRADGSWISLPLLAIDKTGRTLTAELAPTLFAALGDAGAAASARVLSAGSAAQNGARVAHQAAGNAAPAGGWVEFTVTRYLAFYLQPQRARVAVKKSLRLVPHARVLGQAERCSSDGAAPVCVVDLVLTEREMTFLNSKSGFDRRWSVAGVEGGNSVVGLVQPSGTVGAVFVAPDRVPSPPTVVVGFQSREVASGRTVTLSAQVEITPDDWVGTLSAVNGPSDAGTTFTALADVRWTRDDAASTDTRKVFRASGSVDVVVSDDDCVVSVTPSHQAVVANPQLAELVVDESHSPAQYTLRLIAFWPATLSASCPGGSGSSVTPAAGYGWDVSGTVDSGGNRIEGRRVDESGAAIEWSFTRPSSQP